jgi:hypothetical protein
MAIASISTGTPFGNWYTATQVRAGLCLKCFSYSAFISAKFFMSVRKTCGHIQISKQTFMAWKQKGGRDAYTNSSHSIHARAGGLEDCFDVCTTLGRLLSNGTFDQIA